MIEHDDTALGTPGTELLGTAAFDSEPLQLPANVKAELMARIPPGGSENARIDVVELPRRRTQVRRLTRVAAAVSPAAGGFAAGRVWTMRGVSDETKFNVLNQAFDYSQTSHKMADGHTIRLVWSHKEYSVALVMPAGMQTSCGKAVQAWSAKGRRMTSMGIYPSGGKARCAFSSAMPDEGESVMLTVEPTSGSSAPSSDMVADILMGKK